MGRPGFPLLAVVLVAALLAARAWAAAVEWSSSGGGSLDVSLSGTASVERRAVSSTMHSISIPLGEQVAEQPTGQGAGLGGYAYRPLAELGGGLAAAAAGVLLATVGGRRPWRRWSTAGAVN